MMHSGKNKWLNRNFALLLLLLSGLPLRGQDNVSLKFFGLSIHPKGDENAFLMPRRLDDEGILVINLGGMAGYEKFFYKDEFSVKVIQALYSDCAAQLGGFSHIGVRGKIFKTSKHALYGGIGPTLVYRRNWQHLDGYINPNYFWGGTGNAWQYKFIWYGGEFEYAYRLSNKLEFATTFVPGFPKLMSLSFGFKYLTGAD